MYRGLLADMPGVVFQPIADWADPAPWLFSILIKEDAFGRSRDGLIEYLESLGVETRPFFIPLHKLPPFRESSENRGDSLPCSDELGEIGLNLPTYSTMSNNDIENVVDAIKRAHDG